MSTNYIINNKETEFIFIFNTFQDHVFLYGIRKFTRRRFPGYIIPKEYVFQKNRQVPKFETQNSRQSTFLRRIQNHKREIYDMDRAHNFLFWKYQRTFNTDAISFNIPESGESQKRKCLKVIIPSNMNCLSNNPRMN